MRCTLTGVLIQDAEVMILDEQTNFLDLLSIILLHQYLISLRSNLAIIIHLASPYKDFMDYVCEEVIMLREKEALLLSGQPIVL